MYLRRVCFVTLATIFIIQIILFWMLLVRGLAVHVDLAGNGDYVTSVASYRRSKRRKRRGAVMVRAFNPMARGNGGVARNWITQLYQINGAGTPVAGGGTTSYGDASVFALAPAAVSTWALDVIVPVPTTSGMPTVGAHYIDRIKGKIYATPVGTIAAPGAGVCCTHKVSVGVYITQCNTAVTNWETRSPNINSDAQRDDYFYLETQVEQMNLDQGAVVIPNPASPANHPIEFDIDIPINAAIGSGQALVITVQNGANSPGTINVYLYMRALVGPVA